MLSLYCVYTRFPISIRMSHIFSSLLDCASTALRCRSSHRPTSRDLESYSSVDTPNCGCDTLHSSHALTSSEKNYQDPNVIAAAICFPYVQGKLMSALLSLPTTKGHSGGCPASSSVPLVFFDAIRYSWRGLRSCAFLNIACILPLS